MRARARERERDPASEVVRRSLGARAVEGGEEQLAEEQACPVEAVPGRQAGQHESSCAHAHMLGRARSCSCARAHQERSCLTRPWARALLHAEAVLLEVDVVRAWVNHNHMLGVLSSAHCTMNSSTRIIYHYAIVVDCGGSHPPWRA